MTRRRALPTVGLMALGAAVLWWSLSPGPTPAAAPEPAAAGPAPASAQLGPGVLATVSNDQGPQSSSVEALIAGLVVVDALPDVPGYDRGCGTDKKTGGREGCVFGPAWTDDSSAPMSHNGCDTRNDVLRAQLSEVSFKPGTHDCKVVSGILADPYTGAVIRFRSGATTSAAVQIDHVYPLSRAWDAGAGAWPLETRVAFANDADLNLLASDGPTNQSKSDSGLDGWLPPSEGFRCDYATRYLTVAATYHLTVTTGDVEVARSICGSTQAQEIQ